MNLVLLVLNESKKTHYTGAATTLESRRGDIEHSGDFETTMSSDNVIPSQITRLESTAFENDTCRNIMASNARGYPNLGVQALTSVRKALRFCRLSRASSAYHR
jgi:hypothetical protein